MMPLDIIMRITSLSPPPDTAALAICMENQVPVQVFNLHKKGNIKRAVLGEDIGTLIY